MAFVSYETENTGNLWKLLIKCIQGKVTSSSEVLRAEHHEIKFTVGKEIWEVESFTK